MATHEVPYRNGFACKKNEKKGDKNEVTDQNSKSNRAARERSLTARLLVKVEYIGCEA